MKIQVTGFNGHCIIQEGVINIPITLDFIRCAGENFKSNHQKYRSRVYTCPINKKDKIRKKTDSVNPRWGEARKEWREGMGEKTGPIRKQK